MVSYFRLIDALGAIPDPRRARGRRFPLPYLLLFCVLAVLSGAKSFTHIVIFMRERREVLNQVFGSKFKSAPSINTVRLLLHAIGGEPLEATARGYAEHLVSDGAARDALPLIALDGKTLRGSFDHINDRQAVHTLSALAVAEKIVLAHFAVDGKTNEIPCVPALIRQLSLAGVIYSGDAMNCQKETFRAAAESNSYVLAQVKGNQPTLYRQILDAFETAGLAEVRITKLNEKSCFLVGDAQVRETKIEAVKRSTAVETSPTIAVLYRGPLREVHDDFGFTYRRGTRTPTSPQAVAALRSSGLAESFTIFEADGPNPGGGCGN